MKKRLRSYKTRRTPGEVTADEMIKSSIKTLELVKRVDSGSYDSDIERVVCVLNSKVWR